MAAEEEEDKDDDNNSILHKVIESWKGFEYSLREDDRILFNQMLNECKKEEYTKALNAKGEYNSTESLFMALIFQHQKIIINLINKLSYINKGNKK